MGIATREKFLWTALASVGDGVITTDAEGQIAFLNGVAESLTGWSLAEAAGKPLDAVFQIVNEHTRGAVENPAARALREGGIVGLANHTVLIAKGGAEHPIDDSAAPIRDEQGKTIGCVLVFRDITRRRKAERALERSEGELADFFENANVPLHRVGPDGIILRANQAELDLLGYPEEEYVGHHIAEFHADRPVIDDILSRLLRGESVNKQPSRLRCKDGSIREVLINSTGLWENGKFIHSRCFTLDVTDRKRAEEARTLLAAVVSASDDAIVSKTLEGKILSWNAGAERIFGYNAAEAIGQPINLIIPPEFRDEERTILERLRQGQRIDHYETVRVAKDGRRIDVSLTISPLRDEQDRIVGASKIARDVTERRRIEQARREGEAQFRLMADAAPVLIWVSDAQNKGIFFNEGWLSFTGRTLERELGDGWLEVIHSEDVQRAAATVISLFHPSSRAQFEKQGPQKIGDRDVFVYNYKIEEEYSSMIINADGKTAIPPHHGKVWLDSETGRAIRGEREATYLPSDFPRSSNTSVLEYAEVEIEGRSYLLPARAQNASCQRGSAFCTRLDIEFLDYRKFSSESTLFTTDSDIEFGQEVPDQPVRQPSTGK